MTPCSYMCLLPKYFPASVLSSKVSTTQWFREETLPSQTWFLLWSSSRSFHGWIIPCMIPPQVLMTGCTFFKTSCLTGLDFASPLNWRHLKSKLDPWLSEHTRSLRYRWRRLECKCRKDKLLICDELRKNVWLQYKSVVRDARNHYFASIISANFDNQHVLYKTLHATLSLFDSLIFCLCGSL